MLDFQRGNICLVIEDSTVNGFDDDDNVIGGSKEIFLFLFVLIITLIVL